jgi:D-hydroxyproline dehydrogenase subunit gamma
MPGPVSRTNCRQCRFDISFKKRTLKMTRIEETVRSPREELRVFVNGHAVSVPAGASVAVAILQAGVPFRISVSGEPRSALCAMGICEECRATVDGLPHVRTCQRIAADRMEIVAG